MAADTGGPCWHCCSELYVDALVSVVGIHACEYFALVIYT